MFFKYVQMVPNRVKHLNKDSYNFILQPFQFYAGVLNPRRHTTSFQRRYDVLSILKRRCVCRDKFFLRLKRNLWF